MSSSAKAAEQLPGKLQHAHIPFPHSFTKQRFQAVLNVAHSQEPQSSESRMTQSSWLQCQEGLSPWTRETPWLYTEAHLDKKPFFPPSAFSRQPRAAVAQKMSVAVGSPSESSARWEEGGCTHLGSPRAFPAAGLCLWKLTMNL